jgi:hypothetical protein
MQTQNACPQKKNPASPQNRLLSYIHQAEFKPTVHGAGAVTCRSEASRDMLSTMSKKTGTKKLPNRLGIAAAIKMPMNPAVCEPNTTLSGFAGEIGRRF